MKTFAYAGVDPGKSGAFAVLTDTDEIRLIDWPKDDSMLTIATRVKAMQQQYDIKLVAIERVHAMPKQGVKSMFSFGQNFGAWLMLLTVLELPHVLVTPQAWMKNLVAKSDGPDPKSRVRNACKRMFPKASVTGPQGGYKDGRADALMLALYARRLGFVERGQEAAVEIFWKKPRRNS